MSYQRILIVGLGLIGGSLLKLARLCFPESHLIGVTRNLSVLEDASASGLLDETYTQDAFLNSAPHNVDLVFVATPISTVVETIHALSKAIESQCLFVDLSSTKESIHQGITLEKADHDFVGGHPLAGSHNQGFSASTVDLFKGAKMVLTGGSQNSNKALSVWFEALGMQVILMDPKEHDQLLAISSHIPYFMSLLCLAPVDNLDESTKENLKSVLASGFRDTTRIAASDPNWALDLCEHNQEAVLAGLERIKTVLEQLTDAISCGDRVAISSLIDVLRSTKQDLDSK